MADTPIIPPDPIHDTPPSLVNAWEKPLRYLIANDEHMIGKDNEIIEGGYNAPHPKNGMFIDYCNLLDQVGRYGPYLKDSDTGEEYDERRPDPHGAGWIKSLKEQADKAIDKGADGVELDNPDSYSRANVLAAVDYFYGRGLKVAAKNPLICDWDSLAYVQHPAIIGIIVEEADNATAGGYDALRRRAGKPDLPIWFVAFKDGRKDGKAWIEYIAENAKHYKNMWCTYSPDGEYTSSEDVNG